jgi:TolB-like protein/Tfp pilus assembly protein PilF
MSKLELLLLGHFECLLPSGEPATLPMRKAEVLLAYLALAPDIRHPRERLINLLWSDRGEEQARNSLRQALSSIKKTLGDDADLVLQVDRGTASLSAALIDVDVHEFEQLAATGDFESLSTAAGLYQGEFLEGITIRDPAGQDWLENERGRFKRQYIEILTNLAETQLASHDFGTAIKSAERLVQEDPLRESSWRLLMQAYHQNGERNQALQAFKRCQRLLREELEVDPEKSTLELKDRIANGDSAAASPPVPASGKPAAGKPASTDHSIAVLPFDNMSGDPEQEYFSDGITASIILGLGLFGGLTVKSQQTSFAFRDSRKSSEEIALDLGVDYLVEGSIRKSSDRVRLSVQLIETASGNQVWGKQYDAALEDILGLEQELSSAIAGTISGRIGHTLQQSATRKPAKNLQSFDYLLRGLYHFGKMTAGDLAIAREEIGKCLDIDPDNATAHTNLGEINHVEVLEGWSKDSARSIELAGHHLEKAVEIDPDNATAHAFLAEFLFNHHDYRRSEFHADRAIELNPTAPDGYMAKADVLGFSRRFDEAIECADQCLRLDPHSVGSGWSAGGVYLNAGQFEQAIKIFRSISHPPASIHALVAAAFIGLGLTDEARYEMQRYRELARLQMPVYPQSEDAWRSYWRGYQSFRYEEDFEELFARLLEAGLCDDLSDAADAIPSIAVLPFENMSDDPEQGFFSDGITADIIATLSKFKHLRIVARHSTEIYRKRKASIAEIAAEQGVRYILEGSVRKSGKRIRVSAELIDSQTGQNCWSERYDRDLDDLFAVQDEITQQITLAMKVHLDDGEKAARRSVGTNSIKAWELALTAVDLQDTYIQQNIIDSRAMLKRAIDLDPGYCYAWIFLGWTHWQEAYSGWCESFEESMAAAQAAVDKALELEPDNGEAWSLAGTLQVMNQDADQAIEACREALRLEPGNAEVHALAGFALNFVGDYEKASEHFQKALQLGPLCPNWYYLIGAQAERAIGDPEEAIALLRRGVEVETDSPLVRFYLANALLDNGDEAGARRIAGEIRRLDKSMTGKGLVQCFSHDASVRAQFQRNLESLGLV